ncbi:MAG TPA: DUF995 domain-containing protein [Rhizobiaceae bacterium]|nr:DUF995 domain-containing protein [Rhizobiaceae bacterium]
MYSIRSSFVTAALGALLLAGNAGAAPMKQADAAMTKLAMAASPMKAAALEKLYADRTWKWKTGGGFFSSDRKRFVGWAGRRIGRSYGEGRWYATDGGKLCLQAIWSGLDGSGAATKCFLHRERNGVIYQKPSLGGKWYVFRHNPIHKDDEARKLVKGDRVSKDVSQIKATRR